MQRLKRAVKRLVFGKSLLPQEFSLGMLAPQQEITVWLCGPGIRRDVTNEHSTACSAPFALCLRTHKKEEQNADKLELIYTESGSPHQVLGKIALKAAGEVRSAEKEFHFFEARNAQNRCMPMWWTQAYQLLQLYRHLRRPATPGMKMKFLEEKAAMVSFIRPHPIGIASIEEEAGGNIFVMNLMGNLGKGWFGFGLKDSRWPAHLVERTRRLALATVPASKGRQAFSLAAQHTMERVEWEKLPFGLRRSQAFGIRVPEFALKVRELQVESFRKIGSHTFFIARIVNEESWAEGDELHVVHGTYQARRMKNDPGNLRDAIALDASNKQGLAQ